jgi:hypothetical protein
MKYTIVIFCSVQSLLAGLKFFFVRNRNYSLLKFAQNMATLELKRKKYNTNKLV